MSTEPRLLDRSGTAEERSLRAFRIMQGDLERDLARLRAEAEQRRGEQQSIEARLTDLGQQGHSYAESLAELTCRLEAKRANLALLEGVLAQVRAEVTVALAERESLEGSLGLLDRRLGELADDLEVSGARGYLRNPGADRSAELRESSKLRG